MNKVKPYTAFGKTKMVPVKIWHNGKLDPYETDWDATIWIERGEDWYALMSPQLKHKRVRIIERSAWLSAKGVEK